jgi:hypothetical protein
MSATQKLMPAAGDYSSLQPACPSCGRALQLSRIMPGTSQLPDLRTYACRECGVWLTEADRRADAKDPSS